MDRLSELQEKLNQKLSLDQRLEIEQEILDLKLTEGSVEIYRDDIECIGCGS